MLTQQQKNIKIAEACGFEWLQFVGGKCLVIASNYPEHDNILRFDDVVSDIPNYHLDLNACHEMEKCLSTVRQWDSYRFNIRYNSKTPTMNPSFNDADIIHATSQQRAEAFGLLMGLWKDGD